MISVELASGSLFRVSIMLFWEATWFFRSSMLFREFSRARFLDVRSSVDLVRVSMVFPVGLFCGFDLRGPG